jgi:hypothetical protein
MISKCANPECCNQFRYLGEGQLFPFELKDPSEPCKDVPNAVCLRKPRHHTIFFWLCPDCAGRMSLRFDPRTGLSVAPAGFSAPGAPNQSRQ